MKNLNFILNCSLSTSEVVIVISVWCVIAIALIAVGALVWLLNRDFKKKGGAGTVP